MVLIPKENYHSEFPVKSKSGSRYLWVVTVILSAYVGISAYIFFTETVNSGRNSSRPENSHLSLKQQQKFLSDATYQWLTNNGSMPDIEIAFAEKLEMFEKKLEIHWNILDNLKQISAEKETFAADLHRSLEDEKRKREQLEQKIQQTQISPQTSTSNNGQSPFDTDRPGITHITLPRLKPTSIWCFGQNKTDRICRFNNLYYHPERQSYFAVITNQSLLVNVPGDRSRGLVDLCSIDDHSAFFFDYDEVTEDRFQNVEVEHVGKRTFLMKRFHVGNIMHTLHDDIIGLYHVIRQFSMEDQVGTKPDFASFKLDHYIQLDDGFDEYEYGPLFKLLTDYPLRLHKHMEGKFITCFQDVIVGQSKLVNWYQYGFLIPQGPIADKQVDGRYVRQAANFIQYRLDLPQPTSVANQVVIFSRKGNRLISNENDLLTAVTMHFGLPGQFLRMEDQNFKEQVEILQRTKIAIGMHGSMLIMGMFMPPGSILIELYPFAVPSNNYTPYRVMCRLPNMNLAYRAWENKHENNNVMHPDNDLAHGGIKHLPEDEQKKILTTHTVPVHFCCTDPYWLFRIYQDTIVETKEVIALIEDAMKEVNMKNLNGPLSAPELKPSVVKKSTIWCEPQYQGDQVKAVHVGWETPWNGVKPDQYLVWEHISYQEYQVNTNSVVLQSYRYQKDTTLQIWIRTVKNGVKGSYSEQFLCDLKTK